MSQREFLQNFLFIMALAVASVFGNAVKVTLFFNVDFLFGSIFTMIALFRFGPFIGIPVALLSSSWTYIIWNHPYAIIIFTMEALFVWFAGMNKRIPIVTRSMIYWVLIGMPLVWFFYSFIMDMDRQGWMLIALKQAVNGIFNTYLAGVLILFIEKRNLDISNIQIPTIPRHTFNAIIGSALSVLLAFTIIRGKLDLADLERHIVTFLEEETKIFGLVAANNLSDDPSGNSPGFSSRSWKDFEKIASETRIHFFLLDPSNLIAYSNQKDQIGTKYTGQPGHGIEVVNKNVMRSIAPPEENYSVMKRWKESLYITTRPLEGFPGWSIVLHAPVGPYQSELYSHYIRNMLYFLIAIIFSILIGHFTSYWIGRSLYRMEMITTSLPERIYRGEELQWPSIRWSKDISNFLNRFRHISDELAYQYSKITAAKTELEKSVSEQSIEIEQTTRELILSQEQFALAIESTRDGLWDINHTTRTVLFSPRFYELLEFENNNLPGGLEFWESKIHPEDRFHFDQAMRQLESKNNEYIELVVRMLTNQNTYRWFLIRGKGHFNEAMGVNRSIGFITDITRQMETEKQLRIADDKLEIILEALENMYLFSINKDFTVGAIHGSYAKQFGLHPASINGKPLEEAFGASMGGVLLDHARQCEHSGIISFEWTNMVHARALYTRFTLSPVFDQENRFQGITAVAYDVTDDRELEEYLKNQEQFLEKRVQEEIVKQREKEELLIQQSRMAAMGEMLASITHQWRQPLAAIHLIIQEVEDAYQYGELNEQAVQSLTKNGYQQIEYMNQTINDFRTFFQPSNKPVAFSIETALFEVIHLIEPQFRNKKISIHFEKILPADRSEFLGFPNEFKQAILNFLTNSRDAILSRRESGQDRGNIWLRLEQTRNGFMISIEDDGGGIPDSYLKTLFQPYITSKGSEGTGIGLYISRLILEKMNGVISVYNAVLGAHFEILLKKKDHTTDEVFHESSKEPSDNET